MHVQPLVQKGVHMHHIKIMITILNYKLELHMAIH